MIRNAELLTPRDGRRWREYRSRVIEHPNRDAGLALLDRGQTAGIDRKLVLEGPTSADCLVECEQAVIWIEGKRNDWLDYSTTWDVTRDQLARNAEAAWLYASRLGKESCVIVCHEDRLKHHEQLLLDGYRAANWSAGWPHLSARERRALGARIGTIRWATLAEQWPPLREPSRDARRAAAVDSIPTSATAAPSILHLCCRRRHAGYRLQARPLAAATSRLRLPTARALPRALHQRKTTLPAMPPWSVEMPGMRRPGLPASHPHRE